MAHISPPGKNENHKITNIITSITQSHSGYRAFAAGYNGWPEPRDLDGLNSNGEDNDDDDDEDDDDNDGPIDVKPFARAFNDDDDNDEDDDGDDDASSASTDVHWEQDSL